jgi:hypothetical protein
LAVPEFEREQLPNLLGPVLSAGPVVFDECRHGRPVEEPGAHEISLE